MRAASISCLLLALAGCSERSELFTREYGAAPLMSAEPLPEPLLVRRLSGSPSTFRTDTLVWTDSSNRRSDTTFFVRSRAITSVEVLTDSVWFQIFGIPFGPSQGWSGTTLKPNMAPFSMSQDATTPATILPRIAQAKARGLHLVLGMTGGSSAAYFTDSVFDMRKWRARLQTFNTPAIRQAVAEAVSQGVVVGGSAIDEPFHPRWGSKGTFTKARVDSMCAEYKALFPTLPVGPTHDHGTFEPDKSYQVCDFYLSQYRWAKTRGNIAEFRDAGLTLARRDGHRVAFSLNVLDGGIPDRTGAWDCPGTAKGTLQPNCWMTPDQIRAFGKVLGSAGCFLMMWRFHDELFAKAEYQHAFQEVADSLRNLPAKSCSRR